MVDAPGGETFPEIAARTGRSLTTVQKGWSRHPDWPTPVGKRGRWNEYAPADVDRFIQDHIVRPAPALDPLRLYTAQEIHAAGGPSPSTINSERSRGNWPPADDTTGRAHRWYGQTVAAALKGRRAYQRSE
ncbi:MULTISPECIES: hypothetical protein [Streptomycetaceae]|uniref:Uncharacterized protein n=1 Tax=Streptantibioticus cattleyicolor (strain ATCC 35852 / DSM 46488 / JCM 4925 / NBRC 14057 / NRRL 8057) TaxID=1003195 RepID=F8JY36_STREN|nr:MULTISPECIES: hypothetical protein [Streptomycetaceae]AEW94612.1 hypothetical protein SCATT_22410 [Streptantibioticus cattleyicolor NRRL 8057 = DSM 46488]MYS59250.1 hypothetical protein [Streptomyces sp. SID5468]CCB74969.1 protein of unknown function [Streptantibioticus cattleyicolor NRRL 8057 = DSM 46488]